MLDLTVIHVQLPHVLPHGHVSLISKRSSVNKQASHPTFKILGQFQWQERLKTEEAFQPLVDDPFEPLNFNGISASLLLPAANIPQQSACYS
jgi:hypothetical protein